MGPKRGVSGQQVASSNSGRIQKSASGRVTAQSKPEPSGTAATATQEMDAPGRQVTTIDIKSTPEEAPAAASAALAAASASSGLDSQAAQPDGAGGLQGPDTPSPGSSSVKPLVSGQEGGAQAGQQDDTSQTPSSSTQQDVSQEAPVPPVQQEPPAEVSSPASLPLEGTWGSVNPSPEQHSTGPAANRDDAPAAASAAATGPETEDELAGGADDAALRPAGQAPTEVPEPSQALAAEAEVTHPGAAAAPPTLPAAGGQEAAADDGEAAAAGGQTTAAAEAQEAGEGGAGMPAREQAADESPKQVAPSTPAQATGPDDQELGSKPLPASETPAITQLQVPSLPAAVPTWAPAPKPSEVQLPVPSLPEQLLPAVGACDLSEQQLSVLGAWWQLYCPGREADQAAALAKHYDPAAGFEDNFVTVSGHDQIAAQFYAIQRLTAGIDVELEKVEVLGGASRDAAGGGLLRRAGAGAGHNTYQLRIISRIYFNLPAVIRGPVTSLVLPKALEAWATDTLTVRASDGQVLHHQQRVHNIPTLPWLVRWPAGLITSWGFMHLLGW